MIFVCGQSDMYGHKWTRLQSCTENHTIQHELLGILLSEIISLYSTGCLLFTVLEGGICWLFGKVKLTCALVIITACLICIFLPILFYIFHHLFLFSIFSLYPIKWPSLFQNYLQFYLPCYYRVPARSRGNLPGDSLWQALDCFCFLSQKHHSLFHPPPRK